MAHVNWINALIVIGLGYIALVLASGVVRFVLIGGIVLIVALGTFHVMGESGVTMNFDFLNP